MKTSLALVVSLALASTASGQIGTSLGPAGPASGWGVGPLLEALPVAVNLGVCANGPQLAFFVVEYGQGAGEDLNGDGDTNDNILATYHRGTRQLVVTDLDGRFLRLGDGFVALHRFETDSGSDLNGDGDASDELLFIYDLATRTAQALPGTVNSIQDVAGDLVAYGGGIPNLDLFVYSHASGAVVDAGAQALGAACGASGVAYIARESSSTGDLNGDGDLNDFVLRHLNADLSTTVESGTPCFTLHDFDGDYFVFSTRETNYGADLNGDGDTADTGVFEMNVLTGTTPLIGVIEDEISPRVRVAPGRVLFRQDETFAGDLNADGDTDDRILVAHLTGTVSALSMGLPAFADELADGRVFARVDEGALGADLSGDGDQLDEVAHTWDLGTGVVTNLGLPVYRSAPARIGGAHAVFLVAEYDLGADLNGDGDKTDEYPQIVELATGKATRLPWTTGTFWAPPALVRGFLFRVTETQSGDLNGDGDTNDTVLFEFDLSDGRLWNLRRSVNQGITFSGQAFTFYAFETADQTDHTGDGDNEDRALFLTHLR